MTKEELAAELEASRERQRVKREAESPHVKQPFTIKTPILKRGLSRKLREDEYVPAWEAVEVSKSAHR